MDQYLRDKINVLEDLIRQEELVKFQNELVVAHGERKIGDAALARQFEAQANNARTVIKASEHKLETYREQRDALKAELDGEQNATAS